MAEIEAAWAKPQAAWARRRLLVVPLIAPHELTVAPIARVAEVSRQTVFTCRDTLLAGGVPALLSCKRAPGRKPAGLGAVATEFVARLAAGKFRQARDARAWITKRTRQRLSERRVRQFLHRLGGQRKVPRKSPAKKDPAKARAFKAELPARLTAVVGTPTQPVRLWVRDAHRDGLLPVIRRVLGGAGCASTPPAPRATSGATAMKRWRWMGRTPVSCC